jgi:hypothetical protein
MVKGLVELSNHLPDARRQLASLTVQCLLGVSCTAQHVSCCVLCGLHPQSSVSGNGCASAAWKGFQLLHRHHRVAGGVMPVGVRAARARPVTSVVC